MKKIINDDGSIDNQFLPLLSKAKLVDIIKKMILNRVMDERLMKMQRQGRLGFYLTSTGEEATIIGASACLNPNDPIYIQYREMGCLLERNIPLDKIINQYLGNHKDTCKGRQMPVHYAYKEYDIPSVSSPVGTQLPQACGHAYACQLQNTGQVTLAFCGEGTTSGNDFHSALNFAGVLNAPVIFLVRNNGYAISTPHSKQTKAKSIACRAEGYGMPGFQIDGNDLLAIIDTMKQAIHRARNQGGPTLIEAITYRLEGHSSSDDPSLYRPKKEKEIWKEKDVLNRTINHAIWRNCWKKGDEKKLVKKYDKEIEALFEKQEKLSEPAITSLFEDVYEKTPHHLREQKENYIEFLKREDQS